MYLEVDKHIFKDLNIAVQGPLSAAWLNLNDILGFIRKLIWKGYNFWFAKPNGLANQKLCYFLIYN